MSFKSSKSIIFFSLMTHPLVIAFMFTNFGKLCALLAIPTEEIMAQKEITAQNERETRNKEKMKKEKGLQMLNFSTFFMIPNLLPNSK